MVGTLVFAGVSFAQAGPPYSIDIELVRPSFGEGGFSGFDVASTGEHLQTRFGALLMYEADPLTLYEAVTDRELGAVVANRMQLALGASIDIQRVTLSAVLPAAASWGSSLEGFSQDGVGVGDAALGARLTLVERPAWGVGVRGGVTLPTGRQEAWIGERSPRLGAGLVASVEVGPVTVASDFGLAARTAVQTGEDFVASNEVTWTSGARLALPDSTRLAATFQVLTRAGLSDFLSGGAEDSVEALGGVEIYPSRRATVAVEAGRGLTQGYGTTDLRLLTRLVVQGPTRKPPSRPPVAGAPPVPPPPPPPIEDLGPEPIAVVKDDVIEIREQPEFIVDTDEVQPYSVPILQAVADIINADPRIAHVAIEGHASAEGSLAHNYELAESRAQAVWEFMLSHGVADARVSYRAYGETRPLVEGETEDALQRNRRVRFVIVRWLPADGPFPDYPDTQVLPWSGEVVDVVDPAPPAPADDDEME